MALQEQLDRFKKQQEKCQSTLTSIAASNKVTSHKFTPAPAAPSVSARAPAPAVKFSNDTERLQHINSIRKAPVGAQIKRVIDLLLEVCTWLSYPLYINIFPDASICFVAIFTMLNAPHEWCLFVILFMPISQLLRQPETWVGKNSDFNVLFCAVIRLKLIWKRARWSSLELCYYLWFY